MRCHRIMSPRSDAKAAYMRAAKAAGAKWTACVKEPSRSIDHHAQYNRDHCEKIRTLDPKY